MRKLFFLPLLTLALACADNTLVEPETAFTPGLSAAEAPSSQGTLVKMVPFSMKGTWWRGSTGAPELCDGIEGSFPSYPTWEGIATHMGRGTGAATNCLSIQSDGSYFLHLQSATFVAANGDLLFAFGSEADDGTQIIVHDDMSFEIFPVPFVGGTGRFANATGYYHLYGESLGGGAFTAEGLVSSVGSSK